MRFAFPASGCRTSTSRPALLAALIPALALGTVATLPRQAEARVFFGVGFGFPGYYYPPSAYYYPPYPAYYYPPPPAYYYPPQSPAAYPQYPAAAPAPGLAPTGPNPGAMVNGPTPRISYTNRPPFYNSAGQPCREYASTTVVGSRTTQTYGTACRDSSGQWRAAN